MIAYRNIFRIILSHKALSIGIFLILAACIIALFAYWLAPDRTTYRQLFLRIKHSERPQKNLLQILLDGDEDVYDRIPIMAYQQRGDSLWADKYIDEGITEKRVYTNNQKNISIAAHTYYFGTDKFGRDILSRLIIGTRVSLTVGAIAVFISLAFGILLGAVAGYWGGKTDLVIMWFVQVIWSVPTILLVLGVMLLLGKGTLQVFLAIGLSLWVNVARMVRGQVLSAKEQTYVEAARVLGFSHFRILFIHILPNIMGAVWVLAASNFATAIMLEAGLSFLGIGIQPPQPSWGLMMKEHYNFIITNHPMLAITPGIAIMLLVLAFHLVGNGLRDLLDIRSS
jgi:ABC-type dipeptide/oligopeptide/nickel transport system permease subunit